MIALLSLRPGDDDTSHAVVAIFRDGLLTVFVDGTWRGVVFQVSEDKQEAEAA